MSVVLAEAVERAVGRVLAEANGHLEQLVDQELDRRLGQLVADRLTARNGDNVAPAGHSAERSRRLEHSPSAKTCRSCGLEKPADQYDEHRRVCKQCRRERVREMQAARATSEADRPGADAQHD